MQEYFVSILKLTNKLHETLEVELAYTRTENRAQQPFRCQGTKLTIFATLSRKLN